MGKFNFQKPYKNVNLTLNVLRQRKGFLSFVANVKRTARDDANSLRFCDILTFSRAAQYLSYKGWYEGRNLFPENLISTKYFTKHVIHITRYTHPPEHIT